MTNTPKFDKLVAKAVKAGHVVKVDNEKLGAGSLVTVKKCATINNRCLANVTVMGGIESVVRNTSFKI